MTERSTGRAKASDRRAMSAHDVEELLDIQRDLVPREYDEKFWDELYAAVKLGSRKTHQYIMGWRVKKDLQYLQKHGWFPANEGFLWMQIRNDIEDDLLPFAGKQWKNRLDGTCDLLMFLARGAPDLYRIVG